jgi:outer membrane protein TolC
VFSNLFNSSAPDKGVGVNINIPIRNRLAQSDQARSVLEYRQNELRLEQIYVQVRIQVINGQYALTNDRAQVQAAIAAREFAMQSLESEQKKYHLGASTTANVLQQERNLAVAENSLIVAQATYGKDRAALSQTLANTLDHYGISLGDAVSGKVTSMPVIPGLEAPKNTKEPSVPAPAQQQQQPQQQ